MPNDSLRERTRRVVAEFSALDDWVERYRHLVDLGDALPRLDEGERSDENHIPGCQSELWVHAEYDADRHVVHFRADSDARITRGMAALLIRVLDGQPPDVIAGAKLEFLDETGLSTHLSAQRRNGLAAMVHWMKERARAFAGKPGTNGHVAESEQPIQ